MNRKFSLKEKIVTTIGVNILYLLGYTIEEDMLHDLLAGSNIILVRHTSAFDYVLLLCLYIVTNFNLSVYTGKNSYYSHYLDHADKVVEYIFSNKVTNFIFTDDEESVDSMLKMCREENNIPIIAGVDYKTKTIMSYITCSTIAGDNINIETLNVYKESFPPNSLNGSNNLNDPFDKKVLIMFGLYFLKYVSKTYFSMCMSIGFILIFDYEAYIRYCKIFMLDILFDFSAIKVLILGLVMFLSYVKK